MVMFISVGKLRSLVLSVLSEGRLEQVKERFFEIEDVIDVLSQNDPSHSNKYLAWMARQVMHGFTVEKVIESINRFHSNIRRMSPELRDINVFHDVDALDDEVMKVATVLTRRQMDAAARQEAPVIYSDGPIILRRILSHAASSKYGKGTKWCISSRWNDEDWKAYARTWNIYVLINSNNSRKIAIIANKNGDSEWEVYDEQDEHFEIDVDDDVYRAMGLVNIAINRTFDDDVSDIIKNWGWIDAIQNDIEQST